MKNTDITKTKHNSEKANNAKHGKTKLPWFSRLLQHSARKRGGLILQRWRAHPGSNGMHVFVPIFSKDFNTMILTLRYCTYMPSTHAIFNWINLYNL